MPGPVIAVERVGLEVEVGDPEVEVEVAGGGRAGGQQDAEHEADRVASLAGDRVAGDVDRAIADLAATLEKSGHPYRALFLHHVVGGNGARQRRRVVRAEAA